MWETVVVILGLMGVCAGIGWLREYCRNKVLRKDKLKASEEATRLRDKGTYYYSDDIRD